MNFFKCFCFVIVIEISLECILYGLNVFLMVDIVSGNGLLPPDNTPLPGTLLNKIHNAICHHKATHYSDVITSAMASQITGVSIVYSTICSGDQRKHHSASLAFWGESTGDRWIHKGPVTRKMFPFDDVIMMPQCVKATQLPEPSSWNNTAQNNLYLSWFVIVIIRWHNPPPRDDIFYNGKKNNTSISISIMRPKNKGINWWLPGSIYNRVDNYKWMEMQEFRLRFHRSLFPMVQLLFQH